MDRRVMALALILGSTGTIAIAIGCSSGGSGGGGSADPVAQCQEFFTLTQDCYSRAGQEFKANSQACNDPNALDERTRGQIECALASREAYCSTIVAAFTRDASAINPNDPELRKLNQCNAEKTTTGICRDAVTKLGSCGATYYFPPDCTGPHEALAKCVLDNPTGACALYAPREAGTTLPPETQTFQQCQIAASQVPEPDAGEEEEEDAGF